MHSSKWRKNQKEEGFVVDEDVIFFVSDRHRMRCRISFGVWRDPKDCIIPNSPFSDGLPLDLFSFSVLRSFERGGFDFAVPFLYTLPMSLPLGNLKSLAKCPVCNKKYAPAVVTPLIEDDIHSTMHVSCPSCGVSSILFVSTNQWGIASIGVLTDLEGEESKKLLGKEKDIVSTDEALDAYMFFKEEAGKTRAILEKI